MPLLLMWALGGVTLAMAPPEQRAALFCGATWRCCPLLIAALSLPILAAVLHAMRQLAPAARPLWCICLHCPEMAASFVGFRYVLGMLVPAALGALQGPKVLAW